jgi:hypothetical protein
MSACPVVDFSLFQEERALLHLREAVRKAVDRLVDRMTETLFTKKRRTFLELSQALQEARQEFLGDLMGKLIEVEYGDLLTQEVACCPRCGKDVKKSDDVPKTVDSLQGSTTITRPYFYCGKCRLGFYPLDEAVGLCRETKQQDLQKVALELLAEMPFERASELFKKATGISFSDHRMHSLFASFADEVGLEDVIPSAAEIDRRIEDVSAEEGKRPVMVVAVDGAHAPTRPAGGRKEKRGSGEYKEVKGFRMYLPRGDDIVPIASWHQTTDADTFAADLKKAAERIDQDKVRIGLLGDGASWLWRAMEGAFPGGRQILDYYHCSEHIHDLAKEQYKDEPGKALHWVESTMARLSRKGGVSHVVGGLRRMEPRNDDVKEMIRKTSNYLENNKKRIHYKGDKIGGYPIGSGGIESANKFICNTRLKRSGAWWLIANCNNMLKLRCSIYNGTFDSVFAAYATRARAKRFLRNA